MPRPLCVAVGQRKYIETILVKRHEHDIIVDVCTIIQVPTFPLLHHSLLFFIQKRSGLPRTRLIMCSKPDRAIPKIKIGNLVAVSQNTLH